MIALLSMAIIVVAASTRLFLGPLLYFLTCVPAFVLFTVLRRKAAYISLVIAPLLPIIVESIALLTGNFRGGFLVGDIVCLVTALLGLGEERPKERMIRRLGLSGRESRNMVRSLFYTFGRVERIEKVNMSQSYAMVHEGSFHFSVNIPGSGRVNMEIPLCDIEEVAVHQSTSSGDLYYPSLRDMFLPARNIKLVGKPRIQDYFLVVRVAEDAYTFYEEPKTVLELQEEIERERELSVRSKQSPGEPPA
ncbi:MAG TPA: hypothetical protein PKY42_01965 [Mesotoga sp.]|nr:hypothetical protein [Mesotoga sp.]